MIGPFGSNLTAETSKSILTSYFLYYFIFFVFWTYILLEWICYEGLELWVFCLFLMLRDIIIIMICSIQNRQNRTPTGSALHRRLLIRGKWSTWFSVSICHTNLYSWYKIKTVKDQTFVRLGRQRELFARIWARQKCTG